MATTINRFGQEEFLPEQPQYATTKVAQPQTVATATNQPPPDAEGNPFLPAENTTTAGDKAGETAPTMPGPVVDYPPGDPAAPANETKEPPPQQVAPTGPSTGGNAPSYPGGYPGGGGGGGTSTTTTITETNSGTPSNLPDDLSVPEAEGSPWGGNKPDFLQNTPEDMPTATEWEVTEDQLVENRMASLMEDDNPVFMALREQVQRAHAARGGKNSLMASRAAVSMMADMAFKISSQDAATLARSAEFNAAMANQFGLAEQQFIHNAMLSDQNFKQGVMMLREQHKTRIAEIGAQVSGQLAAINAQGAWNSRLEGQRHGNVLEQMELGFQQQWMINEQGQAHRLEGMDRETDNLIRRDDFNYQAQDYAAAQQLGRQMQLQYMTETGATQRQLLDTLGMIRSNPNISPEQAAAATRDAISTYNAMNQQLQSFYTGSAGGGGGSSYTGADGKFQYSPTAYDYLSYGQGGYNTYDPPEAEFWGGTGTVGSPMYGSNPDYNAGMPPNDVTANQPQAPLKPPPQETQPGGGMPPIGPLPMTPPAPVPNGVGGVRPGRRPGAVYAKGGGNP